MTRLENFWGDRGVTLIGKAAGTLRDLQLSDSRLQALSRMLAPTCTYRLKDGLEQLEEHEIFVSGRQTQSSHLLGSTSFQLCSLRPIYLASLELFLNIKWVIRTSVKNA